MLSLLAQQQPNGDFANSNDLALMPIAKLDSATSSSQIVQRPFPMGGHMEGGTRIQQPHLCILCTKQDFSNEQAF